MSYSNLFPLTLEGAAPIYPILSAILCSLCFAALFEFGYNRIIQKLYAQTTQWKMIWRVHTYLILINLPIIILTLSGLIYNNSLLTLQVSYKMDQVYILIISGYICYLQESRQTPVRGFVFLKDCLFILITLSIISNLFLNGIANLQYALSIIPVFLIALLIQTFTDQIQNAVLLLLGVRQKNIYKASFLLTQKSHPSNFLQIKDIIASNHSDIEEQINDFVRIASELKKSNQQLSILTNFARIFIPIKKAYQIHQQLRNKQVLEQYESSWEKMNNQQSQEKENRGEQEQTDKLNSFNHSASSLFIKKTITNDSIFQTDQRDKKQIDQTTIYTILKYMFYPLFLSTTVTGRLRYFIDYLTLGLIAICMFVLANSIAYFSNFFPTNQNVTSLIFCALLFYPTANYFIVLSAGSNDYDFLGIFMQGVITKSVFFSVGLAFLSFSNNTSIMESNLSMFVSMIIRGGTYLILGGILSWRRFAMRYNNFKIFVILFVVSEIVKIGQENIMDQIM